MNILTKELRAFLQHAAPVKNNQLYPDLDSVKIEALPESIVFTRSNNYIFCEYSYKQNNFEEQTFLVSESLLRGMAEIARTDTITIREAGGRLLVSAGPQKESAPLQGVEKFPRTPQINGDSNFEMQKETLDKIQIASRYIAHTTVKSGYSYVHVNADGVFGSDGGFVYYNTSGASFPQIFFDENVIGAIASLENMQYYEAENYDVFSNAALKYAFIKGEYKTFNYMPFIKANSAEYFSVNKSDIIDFCTLVEHTTKEEVPIARMLSEEEGILDLFYEDAAYELVSHSRIKYDGNFMPTEFKFPARGLATALRALPYDQLIFTLITPHYKLTTLEDEGYIGVIAALK